MKDRRKSKGERRSFTGEPYNRTGVVAGIKFKRPERRKTITKAGRRENTKDRRSMLRTEDNYFRLGNEERRKK